MKPILLKITVFFLIVTVVTIGCSQIINSQTEEPQEPIEPAESAEGSIVSILPPCLGNGLLISVENIENFGETGSFMYGDGSLINYQNAIVVPYFSRYFIENSNLITSSISIGDKLIFECRIKTEADDPLFQSIVVCTANIIPPSAPRYIVTKILNYQTISNENNNLQGTQWKLIGIVGVQGNLKELEPKDCEKCYTLSFNTDINLPRVDIFGRGVGNILNGKSEIDYTTNMIHILIWTGTLAANLFDEELYLELLNSVNFFSVQEDKLLLYFDEKKYLLFKLLKQ